MICCFYQSCSASSQSPSTFLEPSMLVLAQKWRFFFFKAAVNVWWHFWRSTSLVVCSIFVCTLWGSVAAIMPFCALHASEKSLKKCDHNATKRFHGVIVWLSGGSFLKSAGGRLHTLYWHDTILLYHFLAYAWYVPLAMHVVMYLWLCV